MPWTRYSPIPARTQGEKHLIDFSVCSQGERNRLTVDTDREKRARVEWPIVNLRTNGTFHGRFWVGLIAVNLARNNLNRARVRDSHLSAINPFAHRSSRSMASLFAFVAGIVLRVYIYFCLFSRHRDHSTHVCSIAREKEGSVAERLRDASICATKNRNCEEIRHARYKISVVVSKKKRRLKYETDSFLRDYLPRENISTCLDLYLFLCLVHPFRRLSSKIYVRDLRKYILGRVKYARLVKDAKHPTFNKVS